MSQQAPRPEFMPTFEEHFDPDVPTLLGCWAKLRRAELHLRDLHAEVGRYIEGNHSETVRNFDPATKVFEARVQVTRLPNYVAWSILLGDFLHNLRSALDHLVWQLVLVSGKRTPDHRNQFPIALREEHYLGLNDARVCGKECSAELQRSIDSSSTGCSPFASERTRPPTRWRTYSA